MWQRRRIPKPDQIDTIMHCTRKTGAGTMQPIVKVSRGALVSTAIAAIVFSAAMSYEAQAGLMHSGLALTSAANLDVLASSLYADEGQDGTGTTNLGRANDGGTGLPSPGAGGNRQSPGAGAHGAGGYGSFFAASAGNKFRRRSGGSNSNGYNPGNNSGAGSTAASSSLTTNTGSNSGSPADVGGQTSNSGASGAGSNPSNPILPTSTQGNTYNFNYTTPGGGSSSQLFFDPPIASGYIYTTDPGSPNFGSVTVETPLPNTTVLSVSFDDTTQQFSPGSTFDFTQFDPNGVPQFTLFGISPTDVQNGGEFNAALGFVDPQGGTPGSFSDVAIPEPGSLTLLALGSFGLIGWRKRRASNAAA